MNDGNELLKHFAKIRTPIALAGGAIVILYLIYHQILNLGIYSKVNSDATIYLIDGILDKVFWLALISLILATGSYIFSLVIKLRPPTKSKIELVDAYISNLPKNKDSKNDNN